MPTPNDDDRKYLLIGRILVTIRYILYAAVFIAVVSAIALAVLYFTGKPLWYAPVIGAAVFIVYRLIRGAFCWLLISFGRHSSGS